MTTTTNKDRVAAAIKGSVSKPGSMFGMKQSEIQHLLEPYKFAIANALPGGGSPDRIIQVAAFQIATNPNLASCTIPSIIGGIMNASILGLNPALKQCWFIPYNNKGIREANFQISYTGLLALARRSGMVTQVYAGIVREGDHFEELYGTESRLVHIPRRVGAGGAPKLAYAVIKYTNGGFEFLVMDRAAIEKRRMKSAYQRPEEESGVWADWTEEMWKKTVLRGLLKTAPLTDTENALATDNTTIEIGNFDRGQLKVEELKQPEEDQQVNTPANEMEATSADIIVDWAGQIADLDSLEAYYKQISGFKGMNAADIDRIKQAFTTRKGQLSKP